MNQRDPKEAKKAFDYFSEFLRQKGLNSTKQRDTIVHLFLNSHEHLSAEELYQKAKFFDDNIGITTVYRTLKLLQEAGLAYEHKFKGNTSFFEFMDFDKHHDHLICQRCGKVIEFEMPELEKLIESYVEKSGMHFQNHHLEIFGICKEPCMAKEEDLN